MKKISFLFMAVLMTFLAGCTTTVKTHKNISGQAGAESNYSGVVEPEVSMSSREIQIALKTAGYYDGAIDGILGSRSREAIRRFQQDNGLKDDSIAGPKTCAELEKYINTDHKP